MRRAVDDARPPPPAGGVGASVCALIQHTPIRLLALFKVAKHLFHHRDQAILLSGALWILLVVGRDDDGKEKSRRVVYRAKLADRLAPTTRKYADRSAPRAEGAGSGGLVRNDDAAARRHRATPRACRQLMACSIQRPVLPRTCPAKNNPPRHSPEPWVASARCKAQTIRPSARSAGGKSGGRAARRTSAGRTQSMRETSRELTNSDDSDHCNDCSPYVRLEMREG